MVWKKEEWRLFSLTSSVDRYYRFLYLPLPLNVEEGRASAKGMHFGYASKTGDLYCKQL
jgi:hypothetical protein